VIITSSATLLMCSLAMALCLPAQSPVTPATSSATVVEYAHAAEVDPLAPSANTERKEAMSFAENDHTSHVLLCAQIFQQLNGNHSANAHEIALQYVISAAAFLYQHPDAAADSTAQNTAGVEAALNVYEKFLAADPKSRAKFLDKLGDARKSGKLKDFIVTACK
jgi:hypothetical protein